MNELKEILMKQLQLLHEYSMNERCWPGELTELSNAMANIASVVAQIGDDVSNAKGAACAGITTGKLACIGTTADKLTDVGIGPPEWVKGLIPEEDYARLQGIENS